MAKRVRRFSISRNKTSVYETQWVRWTRTLAKYLKFQIRIGKKTFEYL